MTDSKNSCWCCLSVIHLSISHIRWINSGENVSHQSNMFNDWHVYLNLSKAYRIYTMYMRWAQTAKYCCLFLKEKSTLRAWLCRNYKFSWTAKNSILWSNFKYLRKLNIHLKLIKFYTWKWAYLDTWKWAYVENATYIHRNALILGKGLHYLVNVLSLLGVIFIFLGKETYYPYNILK